MSYTVGKVTITRGSDRISGTSTKFVDAANTKQGDLFYHQAGGKESILQVAEVIDNNTLKLQHLDGKAFNPANTYPQIAYGIVQDFGDGLTSELILKLNDLQDKWRERESELTGWFASNDNSYPITNFTGEQKHVPTPKRIDELAQVASTASDQLDAFASDIARNKVSLSQVSPKLDAFDAQAKVIEQAHKETQTNNAEIRQKHTQVMDASRKMQLQSQRVATDVAQLQDDVFFADVSRKAADSQAAMSALLNEQVANDRRHAHIIRKEVDSQAAVNAALTKQTQQNAMQAKAAQLDTKSTASKVAEQHLQVQANTQQVAEDTLQADIARKAADAQAAAASLAQKQAAEDARHSHVLRKAVDSQAAASAVFAQQSKQNALDAQSAQQAVRDKSALVAMQHQQVQAHAEQVAEDALQADIARKDADAQAAAASQQALNAKQAAQTAQQAQQVSEQLKQQSAEFKNQTAAFNSSATQANTAAQSHAQSAQAANTQAKAEADRAEQASTVADEQAVKAQDAANLATKVTSDFSAASIPEAGKVPVALGNDQLDEGWINLENSMSRLAVGILHNNLSRFQKGQLLEQLNTQINSLSTQLAQLQSRVEQVANTPSNSVNRDYFDGVHNKGATHELPVFNMVERGWLSDASYQEGMAEFIRMNGGSGIVGTRQYQADKGFAPGHRVIDASYAALNVHNHPNYKAMAGMAEVSACINGYYFRTRHNDYRLMHSVPGKYLARAHSTAVQIPEQVRSLPTGCNSDGSINFNNTQAGYMRDVKTQSPQDCIWEMSFLECWIETFQEELNDPTDSFRHSNDGTRLKAIFDKGRYLNYSGHKNRSENIPYHPMRVSYVDEQGVPQFGMLQFRISSMPVATLAKREGNSPAKVIIGNSASHYHSFDAGISAEQIAQLKNGTLNELVIKSSVDYNHAHDIRITWQNSQLVGEDLHTSHQHPVQIIYGNASQLPYDEQKALKGIIDDTNRFKLVRDLRSRARVGDNSKLIRSRMARFECVDLAELCEQLPGLEGAGSVLEEKYDQYGLRDTLQNWAGGSLNAAYYNRRYRFVRNDASGRAAANRGYNDPTLFCAKTTHPEVVGGFSWMIPMEMILRTPREVWNPYNCPSADYAQLRQQENNAGGKKAESAFTGIHESHFYFGTPKALLTEQVSASDPADTAHTAWVKDENGTPRLLYGNGLRVHDFDGHRQRFPVYPLYFEHSHDANQQHWLRNNLKTLLKQAVNGTLTITDIDEML